MYEISKGEGIEEEIEGKLTIGDLKRILDWQYQLLKKNGNNMVNEIVEICSKWRPK